MCDVDRPCLGVEVSKLTARVARASNPAGTTAMWVRDRLRADEDFAGWYPRGGRPGISPTQLATVCVLQFLLDPSDRDAAEAVRCRIDFKYALGLDLGDPGFHHSVLGDFRDRLLPGPAARTKLETLRQILVQNYHQDPAGRLRWRDNEGDAGLPPSAARIVSPCDLAARYSRRGQVTRWTGYLVHVTETCAEDATDVITDIAAMPATSADR